jgi:NodT family efflux transporter outer membrane factor (OMF) lipoprotein
MDARLGLALLALSLAGCAVGPDPVRPQAPVAERFTREGDTPGPVIPVSATWWQAYGSARLNALVERALAHNPGLAAAEASLASARQVVAAQQGYFYPVVQAGYSGSRQGVGNTLSPGVASGSTLYNLHTAQVSVGYTPDVFGGNRRQVESLQAQADVQRFQLEAARVSLASNVVASVLQAASLRAQMATGEALIELAEQQLAQVRRLRDSGYSSGLDLAGQEAALAQARGLIPPLRRQFEQTVDLIATLCGSTPGERFDLPALAEVSLPARLPSALPSQLVDQRPDVRAAEAWVQAASAQVGVAAANRLPQFSITALLGGGAAAIASLFNGSNALWGVSAGVGQTVFAGGTLLARQRAAEEALTAAQAQYRSTALAAFQNVADTLYALDTDARAVAVAAEAEAANARALALVQGQFERGYVATNAVLSARQTLLQSRLVTLQAEALRLGDSVALHQALGGGWRSPEAGQ